MCYLEILRFQALQLRNTVYEWPCDTGTTSSRCMPFSKFILGPPDPGLFAVMYHDTPALASDNVFHIEFTGLNVLRHSVS